MGYEAHPYPRHLAPAQDPAVDFRAFYPYTPNEVKHRKRTTSAQLKVLETVFKQDTKPNANLRTELSIQLGMTVRGVQVWFQNRRAKEKVKGNKASGSKGVRAASGSDGREEGALGEGDDDDDDDEAEAETAQGENLDASASMGASPPPPLQLVTDTAKFGWQDSPPDSATFPIRPPANPFMSSARAQPAADHFHRRGSLPATAFPHPTTTALDGPIGDPLLRRSSVDTSLQRLANNPFASLARAKNSALYGPGVGVAMPGNGNGNGTPIRHHHHHQFNRTSYGYPSSLRRNVSTTFPPQPLPPHSNTRRLSMDSRASRFSTMQRIHQSPSPSPLTPFNAVIRASLPDHLYAVSSRTVASPIPGPLPSPGFSFGAASTTSMASPSSGDSERNSPDSIRSFQFRSEEHDEDAISPSYDAYSRFGSIASIATSESSINSSYYGELGGTADQNEERRDSCATGHFLGMLSELQVTGLSSFSPHEEYNFSNAAKDVIVPAADHHHQLQHAQAQQPHTDPSYPSTSPTLPQDPPPPIAVPISINSSSELAFALESKHDQHQYAAYGPSEDTTHFYTTQQQPSQDAHPQQQQHQQPDAAYDTSGYTLTNAYTSEAHHHQRTQQNQQQQQQLDYLLAYSPTGAYTDPGAAVGMDNGMQSVDTFAAYT